MPNCIEERGGALKLAAILSRLNGVTEDHDGHLALCPAHADRRHPSLKLTLKEGGQLLVVCRAGCATKDVLTALDLAASDLFDVDGEGTRTISAAAPESVGTAEIAGLRHFVDLTSGWLPDIDEAVDYLEGRFGLAHEAAQEMGVGFYNHHIDFAAPWLSTSFTRYPRLTVPLVGFDGVIRGLQGRDITGKCPARWVSLKNLDGRTWAKWGVLVAGTGYDTILVTEGPGDGLTSVGVGYDALIIRGAGLARNAALIAELVTGLRGRDVVLAFDPDDAGARGIRLLAEALTADGNAPRQLPFPRPDEDLTAWRERDPEGFPQALHAAVRAADVVTLDAPQSVVPTPDPVDVPARTATDAALETMGMSARAVFNATDVGVAVMLRDFMRRSGGGVRYASGLGFLTWDGTVWQPGEARVREALHLMGAELIASGDDDARRLALKALTNRSIDAILKELPSVPGVPADARDFDAEPDLLAVANGVVDLRTGELHPHDSSRLLTRRLTISYVPEALAPRWVQFLGEVFPNHPEMPNYVRRLVGYGITGHTSEQCFVFHHGGGKNGKSVYLDVLRHVFYGVTKASEFSVFEQRTATGQANPELAALRGARLVVASETEKYSRLAEGLIKQLTGGDPITTRNLYQPPITFTPVFLLQVAGNYKPAILSQDYGIWRRVKLVPWEATFEGAARDKNLTSTLKAEAEGILAWAVRGAMEWYVNGLQEPGSVRTATQDYRESEDRLAEFISARLVQEEGARIAPMEVRRAYAEWAEDAGLSKKEVLSGWALGVELESRGFPKDKKRNRWGFNGIRLASDVEQAAARKAATEELAPKPADESADIFGQAREAVA